LYELRGRDLMCRAEFSANESPSDAQSPETAPVTATTATTASSTSVSPAGTVDVEERNRSLRGRKGWGDRSVNALLAAVDRARVLDDHRYDVVWTFAIIDCHH
jgi:hypothetical protein